MLAAPSERQLQALNSLLNQGLTNQRRAVRLEVLRMITGIENLTSSAQLTAYTVRVLIGYLKLDIEGDWRLSEQGKRLLSALHVHAIEVVGDREKGGL